MRCRLFGRKSRLRLSWATSVCCVLAVATAGSAAEIVWDADVSSNWATGDNWVGDALPTVDDDAIITDGLTATVQTDVGQVGNVQVLGEGILEVLNGGALASVGDVALGTQPESPGSLVQSGGDLIAGGYLVIGAASPSTFDKTGGLTTFGTDDGTGPLLMGITTSGILTMSGGELIQANVDLTDSSTINYLGLGPGGEGTINLSGGTISFSASTYLGGDGGATGTVNQTGGVFEVRDRSVRIGGFAGPSPSSSGTYNISGGTLATGTGLSIGYGSFSNGAVNVSDAADVQVGGTIFMGLSDDVNPGHGEINQTGGTVVTGVLHDPDTNDIGNDMLVGYGDESSAAYHLSGGSLTVPGFGILGLFGATETEMTVAGDDTVFNVGTFGVAAFQVGGQTTTNPEDPTFGKPSFGEVTQDAGTVIVNGNLQIGSGEAATGVYNLNGGLLDVSGIAFLTIESAAEFEPGVVSHGDATFNQTGGEAVFRDIALVGYNGKGTISVSGGTLNSDVPSGAEAFIVGIYETSNGSAINISGGEVVAPARVRIADGEADDVSLNVSGDGHFIVGGELYVGGGLDGDNPNPNLGIVNQSGGVVDVTQFLFVGLGELEEAPTARSFGVYNMSGGVLNLNQTAAVGLGGTGTFVQTGGTVNSFNSIIVANDVTAEGTYQLEGGTLELNRQAIFAGDGDATFEFTGGRLSGAQEIGFTTVTQTGGVLSTGELPAFTVISGDYVISDTGALEVKLGGLTQVDEYDIYEVAGVATLGGTLNVVLTNDFVPQIGDLFEVLTSLGGDIVGEFDGISFASNPGNVTGQLIYEPGRVILEIIENTAGLLGDTDNDGDVDLTDLNNVRNHFGDSGLGDTDGDGDVDLSDLNNVRNNFGNVAGSPTSPDTSEVGGTDLHSLLSPRPILGSVDPHAVGLGYESQKYLDSGLERLGGQHAVPEPASWALGLMASLGGLIAWRRRK